MRDLISIGYMNSDTYKFPPHQHSIWEISYYTHGEGILTVGSREFPFQPGTIICQPPGIPHSEYAEKGYRNIFFCIGSFDNSANTVQIYTDSEHRPINNLLMQLHTEFHLRRKNYKSICEGLLNTAYQYMLSFTSEKAKSPYVELLENILVTNLSNQDFRLQKIMDTIPLSKDHARRLFIKETGRTPTEYLTDKRISYAKLLIDTMLEHGGISIKEIALQSGFDDPYYFSRVFKKVTGKSPTDWYRSRLTAT